MSSRIFVLGSGFSRAIHSGMPTLAELSSELVELLHTKGVSIPGEGTAITSDFESWLNYLIDSPPWLSDGDQLRARGAARDVTLGVHQAVEAAQLIASTSEPPQWLARLVATWESESCTVITFNYDLLVEMAWARQGRTDWPSLYPVPVTPAALRRYLIYTQPLQPGGLRLLKLHGSLSWYYSGLGSPPGDPIYDLGVGSASGEDDRYPYAFDRSLVIDKVPMIVPPASLKSPYYGNQMIRALWQEASRTLAAAEEVVIMGFSLPATDQLFGSLLATELAPSASVVPVNPDSSVVDRLRSTLEPGISRLGNDSGPTASHASRISDRYVGTLDAIQQWVGDNCG